MCPIFLAAREFEILAFEKEVMLLQPFQSIHVNLIDKIFNCKLMKSNLFRILFSAKSACQPILSISFDRSIDHPTDLTNSAPVTQEIHLLQALLRSVENCFLLRNGDELCCPTTCITLEMACTYSTEKSNDDGYDEFPILASGCSSVCLLASLVGPSESVELLLK